MEDFTARRVDKVCDIFAPTLRADVDGFPERTFEAQCKVLKEVLADPDHTLSYTLDIKEILADGDMAAVRLSWTLTAKTKSSASKACTIHKSVFIVDLRSGCCCTSMSNGR